MSECCVHLHACTLHASHRSGGQPKTTNDRNQRQHVAYACMDPQCPPPPALADSCDFCLTRLVPRPKVQRMLARLSSHQVVMAHEAEAVPARAIAPVAGQVGASAQVPAMVGGHSEGRGRRQSRVRGRRAAGRGTLPLCNWQAGGRACPLQGCEALSATQEILQPCTEVACQPPDHKREQGAFALQATGGRRFFGAPHQAEMLDSDELASSTTCCILGLTRALHEERGSTSGQRDPSGRGETSLLVSQPVGGRDVAASQCVLFLFHAGCMCLQGEEPEE